MENKVRVPYLKLVVSNSEPERSSSKSPVKVSQEVDQTADKTTLMLSMLDRFIQDMKSKGVSHRILIEGIFMRWLHMVTSLAGYPDDFLIAQIDQSDPLMLSLLFKINEIEGCIPDDPEQFLRLLEEKAIVFKRVFFIADNPPPQDDLDVYVKFQGDFADLLDKFSKKGILNENVEEILLYCWVRAITFMSKDSNAYFEKIDFNWPEIIEGVLEHAYCLMKIIYNEQEENIKQQHECRK